MFSRTGRVYGDKIFVNELEDEEEGEQTSDTEEMDEFGYKKVGCGWLNVYTKKITELRPLDDDSGDK